MSENESEFVTLETSAYEHMEAAIEELRAADRSRECSLAITNLEQAMMWCQKDRANKGQLMATDEQLEAAFNRGVNAGNAR